MKRLIKNIIYPLRKLAASFVEVDRPISEHRIIFKAANIVVSEKIEGDYLEFGVFTGRSFIDAYNTLSTVFKYHSGMNPGRNDIDLSRVQTLWENMRFFAFDSFQGLPELDELDAQTNYFHQGEYQCTEDGFLRNIEKANLPLDKVITITGWFEDTCQEETIKKFDMKKAAIIHIDCDLFSSTKVVLDFIKPLLVDGTVIIFDDWYHYRGNPALGEAGAFNEWMKTMSGWHFVQYQKEGSTRNSFIASKGVAEN